jgi:ABC-2 type transport system permease protein/lipopolysaccharide transport system permease protein
VLLHTIMVGLSMGSLFVLMIPLGARFSLPMVMLPVAIVLFAVFTLGLGMVLSVVNTFYRDAGHLISVVVQAWYFLTPIMYPEAQLPAEIRWRFWLNPVYPFIRVFQLIVSEGEWPGGMLLLVTAGLASVSLGVGYAVFKTYEDKLIFRL